MASDSMALSPKPARGSPRSSPRSHGRGGSRDLRPYRDPLEQFLFIQVIGQGAFGKVFLVEDTEKKGKVLAVKMMSKQTTVERRHVDHVMNERIIMERCDSPFIVRIEYTWQDPTSIYLAMEFYPGGELFTLIQRHKENKLDEAWARFYACQVLLGLEYMHHRQILYRDLKPENILICADGYCRIADLGFAKYTPKRITYTFCGTPEYMAPELFRADKGYYKGVDYWAFGVLMYEMCCGFAPFPVRNNDIKGLYSELLSAKLKFPSHCSKDLRDCVRHLLEIDVTRRYGCLRGGADDIKNHSWYRGVSWSKIAHKQVKPTYVPRVKGPADTSRFVFDASRDDKRILEQMKNNRKQADKYADQFKDW